MKLGVLLTAAAFLGLAPGLAGETVRFHVPFAFVGYDSEFPAGDYIYIQNARTGPATLVNEESLKAALLATRNNRERNSRNAQTLMVFERHGSLYVLREFHSGQRGLVLSLPLSNRRSTLVQSYISQHGPGKRILIAASK